MAAKKSKKTAKKSAKKSKKTAKKTTAKAKKTTKKKAKKVAKKTTAKKKATAKKATKKATTARKISSTKSRSSALTTQMKPAAETTAASTTRTHTLNVGDTAPNFTLSDQTGQSVTLENLRGKTVVLYFYPKDDTPGCTKEACSFRDNIQQFHTKDAIILGVSADDPASHQAFIQKYGLNFSLLADTEKSVSQAYGVWVEKNMYGKTYMGIERTTFIINAQGVISQIFRQVKVDGHTEEVLEALAKIA